MKLRHFIKNLKKLNGDLEVSILNNNLDDCIVSEIKIENLEKSLVNEVWKNIPEYEDCYQVNNFGRIKSLSRKIKHKNNQIHNIKEQIIKPHLTGYLSNNSQYKRVELSKNNISKGFSIHRLVAEAFIDNPENKCCVNHIDGDKHNNKVENLEWVTISENNQHAYKLGLKVSKKGKYSSKSKKIVQKTKSGEIIKVWDCLSCINIDNNFVYQYVSRVLSGKRKHYKGFKWEYYEN